MDFHPEARSVADVPIVNAIDAANYKQALKLVEKRLAKKADDYLYALRFYIRCLHPSATEKALAVKDITSLSENAVAVPDFEALALYEAGARALFPPGNETVKTFMGKMYLTAVKKVPKDEDLATQCFKACIKNQDYDNAQAIAASLENNFKDSHLYCFWSVTSLAFYLKSGRCPIEKQPLIKMLTVRKMKALADATSKAKGTTPMPARSIHNPQELFLLYRILQTFSTTEDQLSYMRDPALGPESKAAKGELAFVTRKLELLAASNLQEEILETCLHYLQKARPNEDSSVAVEDRYGDWQIWSHLLAAAKALDSSDINKRVTEEIDKHIKVASSLDKIARRNVELAQFEARIGGMYAPLALIAMKIPEISSDPQSSYISASIIDYVHTHGDRTATFGDVKDAFYALPSVLQDFTARVLLESSKWPNSTESDGLSDDTFPRRVTIRNAEQSITMSATACKLSYYASMARPHSIRLLKQTSGEEVCNSCHGSRGVFCENCSVGQFVTHLKRYQDALGLELSSTLLTTDKHPADDLAILAAMSLLIRAGLRPWTAEVKSDISKVNMEMVKQAVVVLEFAWSKSTANAQIMLMLIRLYSLLGAGSLAIRAYERLKIKQIQVDSMAYLFVDRLSSLHPHPFKVGDDFIDSDDSKLDTIDPLNLLRRYLGTRRSFGPQINKNVALGLTQANYDATFDQLEVSDRLHMSAASILTVLESRRITRIVKPSTEITASSHGYDTLAPNPYNVVGFKDNADITAFASFEAPDAPPFENYTRLSPSATAARCQAFLLVDKLQMILSNPTESRTRWAEIQQDVIDCRTARTAWQEASAGASSDAGFTSEEIALAKLASRLLELLDDCWRDDLENADVKRPESINLDFEHISRWVAEITARVDKVDPELPYFMHTLHPLYIGHEVAKLLLDFAAFVKKPSSGLKLDSDNLKVSIIRVAESAETLRSLVKEKASKVRAVADAGGRLDSIIDGVIRENDESTASIEGKRIGEFIEGLVGEDFVETWAGDLVGSWDESVIGLTFLK